MATISDWNTDSKIRKILLAENHFNGRLAARRQRDIALRDYSSSVQGQQEYVQAENILMTSISFAMQHRKTTEREFGTPPHIKRDYHWNSDKRKATEEYTYFCAHYQMTSQLQRACDWCFGNSKQGTQLPRSWSSFPSVASASCLVF